MSPEENRKEAIRMLCNQMEECVKDSADRYTSLSQEDYQKTKFFKLRKLLLCFSTENEIKDINKEIYGRDTMKETDYRYINSWSLEEKQKLADKYKTDEEIKDFIVYNIFSAKENNGNFSIGNFHMTLSDEMLKTMKK